MGYENNFWSTYKLNRKKAEGQALKTVDIYSRILYTVLSEMIVYDGVPDWIDRRFFTTVEWYKITNGTCIGVKEGDKLIPYSGGFGGGELDPYGQMTHYIGATMNGSVVEIDYTLENVQLFRNNELFESENGNLERFSELLAQTDISIGTLIKYSRLLPFPLVKDGHQKDAIDHLYDSLAIGKPTALQDDQMKIYDFVEVEPYKVIDITDASNSDKVQYLSKLHDDLLRRFYSYYGHSMSGSQKMAQQTEAEISDHDTISMIYPLARLRSAQMDIEEFNKKFGTNITVRFGDAWAQNCAEIMTDVNNNGIPDEEEVLTDEHEGSVSEAPAGTEESDTE